MRDEPCQPSDDAETQFHFSTRANVHKPAIDSRPWLGKLTVGEFTLFPSIYKVMQRVFHKVLQIGVGLHRNLEIRKINRSAPSAPARRGSIDTSRRPIDETLAYVSRRTGV